jgi:hypothetical protein
MADYGSAPKSPFGQQTPAEMVDPLANIKQANAEMGARIPFTGVPSPAGRYAMLLNGGNLNNPQSRLWMQTLHQQRHAGKMTAPEYRNEVNGLSNAAMRVNNQTLGGLGNGPVARASSSAVQHAVQQQMKDLMAGRPTPGLPGSAEKKF